MIVVYRLYLLSTYLNIYSDHVHRFFGAVSPRTLRPDATFRDLRDADGDTGNVEENRSLYWNPVIYKVATVSTLSTVSTQ